MSLLDDESSVLHLDFDDSITTTDLLSVLIGEDPPAHHLHAFYDLFMALRMDRHASVACKLVCWIKKLDTLVDLAQSCFLGSSVDMPEEEEGLGFATLSPFAAAVGQGLRRLVDQVKEGSDFVRALQARLPPRCSLFLTQDGLGAATSNDDSFRSLFLETTKSLFLSRQYSNVTLRTSLDGGEEEAHVEILVVRNRMFYHMLKFEGKEHGELRSSSRSITMEEFTHSELSALLHWIYTNGLSESSDLPILFRLIIHATMYQEEELLASARRSVAAFLAGKSRSDVCLLLLETGFLLEALPDEFSDWFYDLLPIERDVAESLVEGSCRVVAEVGDLRKEKDEEREAATADLKREIVELKAEIQTLTKGSCERTRGSL